MNRITILFLLLTATSAALVAQTTAIYNDKADAITEIRQATKKAKTDGKHVFLMIGGNWCSWCIKFNRFIEDNDEIKSFANDNFVMLKVNYSKENRNEEVMRQLDFPQRFGFPVFVVLDGQGRRIHTQNSAYLEEDDSYSAKEVLSFFKQWAPAALDPANYNK